MAADATIAMPNGRMNGFHHCGLGDEIVGQSEIEQFAGQSLLRPMPGENANSSAGQSPAQATKHCQPTTAAASQVASSPTKAQRQLRQSPSIGGREPAQENESASPQFKYVPQKALEADLAKLEALSRAALAGDTRALDELRSALDRCPHIWRRLADLEYLIELKLIDLVAGKAPLRSEAFRKQCSELRHHLLDGQHYSLAVKMAASRVVACWLFTQFLDLRALESPHENWCLKQLQGERRFQSAMRSFCLARQADVQLQRLKQQYIARI